MHRRFITAIVVAALAVTSVSAIPARAGDNDANKIVAGALALGLIGAAIAKSNDRDSHAATRNTYDGYNNGYTGNGYRTKDRKHHGNNHGYQKVDHRQRSYKHHHRHSKPYLKPGSNYHHKKKYQYKKHNSYNGYVNGSENRYRPQNNHYQPRGVVQLPRNCRISRQTQNGVRHGYSGRCLRRHHGAYDNLPGNCAVRVGGRYGTIYRDRCLRDYGYAVGRGR